MRGLARLRLSALVSASLLAASPALAEDRATAQQLFEEARALMAKKSFAEACPKLEGATKLVSSPGVRLNLADCYEQNGQMASAWSAFDDAVAAAERAGDAAAAREAETGKQRVAPKRSFLVFQPGASGELPGLELRRDGVLVPKVAWSSATPVDAGVHLVEASAPGRKPWSQRVTVAASAVWVPVTIPALEPEPAATPIVVAPAKPAADRAPAPPAGSARATVAYVAGGVGLAAIGVGAFFAVSSHSKKQEAEELCPGGTCRASTPAAQESLRADLDALDAQATSAGRSAAIAFGVGIVGVGACVTLLLTAPKSSPDASRASLTPFLTPGGAGLTGTF